MNIKNAAKNVGSGLLTATVLIANSTAQTRINEIDKEIKKLQEEKKTLEAQLIRR